MQGLTRGFLKSGMRADYSYRELKNNSVVGLCHAMNRRDVGMVLTDGHLYLSAINLMRNALGK